MVRHISRFALALLLLAPHTPLAAPADAGPPLIGATGAPAMQAAFAPILAERALAGSKVSVLVVPAGGGEPVFGYHADERVHPASNTKLLTTAAALSRLGPAYTFATDLAEIGRAHV